MTIIKSKECSGHPRARVHIVFLGSSHFTQYHHFMDNMLRRKWPPRVRSVRIIASPGGQLDDYARRHVSDVARALSPGMHLHVFSMMACNGVKTQSDIPRMKIEHTKLVDQYTHHDNVLITLCGLIPRPRFPELDPLFREMDLQLMDLIKQHPKYQVDFFDSASLFIEEDDLNYQLFDSDGVHLNNTGAYLLILKLIEHVRAVLQVSTPSYPYLSGRQPLPSPPRPLEHQSPPPLPPSPDHLPPTPPPPPPPSTPPPLPTSHLPCLPAPQPNTRINRTIKLGEFDHIKF